MAVKVNHTYFFFFMLFSALCHGENQERKHYTAIQYLKNYALSACLAEGYKATEVVSDATAGANGYKELGSLDIDAYNKALIIVRDFLKKEYASQSGERLIIMKCIDLYHSKELDQLARKYSKKN